MNLSEDQEEALYRIEKHNFDVRQDFQLGGYAGTGKTELIPRIQAMMRRKGYLTAVVTPTNKAAAVLRKRGIQADTIYSLMYEVATEEPLTFVRRLKLEVDFVIVDESSMIGWEMAMDLESFGTPVIYVGDPFQLKPIEGEEWFKPDFTLTNIHRTDRADIIDLATRIRNMGRWPHHLDKYDISPAYLANRDIVITQSNSLRQMINDKVRKHLGYEGPARVGEKVCVMKSDKDSGVFNGEIGIITDMETNYRFTVDFDGRKVRLTRAAFVNSDQNPYCKELKQKQVLDFGYAATCHKVQGSQFDKVLVLDSPMCDARWMYTAVTRAVAQVEIGG